MQRKHDMLEERMVHHEDLYHSLKTRRPDEVEEILHQIQAGKDIMSVMENLEEGSLPLQLTSPQASYAPLSTNPTLPVHKHTIQAVNNDLSVIVLRTPGLPPGQYEHPDRVIDRTMFEEDLKALNPHTINHPNELRFCSLFLVNALLAVSCLYTTNQATFLLPNDPNTRGQAFAKEAARLLPLEDTSPSLTVAQGLTLMNAYEAVLGNGGTALSYHSRMQTRYLALRLDGVPRFTDVAIAGARQRREAYALSWISWGFYVWDCFTGS
ncbi:hypothetical protein ACHAPK_005103 [Fusarium culmorum]